MVNLSDAIRKRIKNLMKENNIKTINSVAKLAGISNSLHDFMSGKSELLQMDTFCISVKVLTFNYGNFSKTHYLQIHFMKRKKIIINFLLQKALGIFLFLLLFWLYSSSFSTFC